MKTTRIFRLRFLTLLLVMAGTLLFGSHSFAELTGLAWVDGHGHIEPHLVPVNPLLPAGPKKFDLHWHIGEALGSTVIGLPPVVSQDFEPDEIFPVIPLVSNSNFNRPADSSWGFTGAIAGQPLFVIPLSVPPANEVLPRLGLASDLNIADWVGNNLTVAFNLLPGAPGQLSIFDGDLSSPNPVRYTSFNGVGGTFLQQAGDHYHHNYAFTAPGIYDVEITISGTHITDGPVTGSSTFQFFVGDVSAIPEPSSTMLLLMIGCVGLSFQRRLRLETP